MSGFSCDNLSDSYHKIMNKYSLEDKGAEVIDLVVD